MSFICVLWNIYGEKTPKGHNGILYTMLYLLHLRSPSLRSNPSFTMSKSSRCIVFSLQSVMVSDKSFMFTTLRARTIESMASRLPALPKAVASDIDGGTLLSPRNLIRGRRERTACASCVKDGMTSRASESDDVC